MNKHVERKGKKEKKSRLEKKEKTKMEEERKKKEKKKREAPQNCKSLMWKQGFIATIKSVTEYTHIRIHHKQTQKNPAK